MLRLLPIFFLLWTICTIGKSWTGTLALEEIDLEDGEHHHLFVLILHDELETEIELVNTEDLNLFNFVGRTVEITGETLDDEYTVKMTNIEPAESSDEVAISNSYSPTGVRKVLALRVKGSGGTEKPSFGRDDMRKYIFGERGDQDFNLADQIARCSFGKLYFEPLEGIFNGVRISAGVVDIVIDDKIEGRTRGSIENDVKRKLKEMFGTLYPGGVQHIMQCFPKGSLSKTGGSKTWGGVAFVPGKFSKYNDDKCLNPSTTMHELTHNLYVKHSGEGSHAYADKTGIMGFSYRERNGPYMCFNPAKNYQLGWYSDRISRWNKYDATKTFSLVGVAEYDKTSLSDTVVLKTRRYYIGFNRAIGMNKETHEAKDKVTVVHAKNVYQGRKGDASWKLAELGEGESYTNDEEGYVIKVTSIDTSSVPGRAYVEIRPLECPCPGGFVNSEEKKCEFKCSKNSGVEMDIPADGSDCIHCLHFSENENLRVKALLQEVLTSYGQNTLAFVGGCTVFYVAVQLFRKRQGYKTIEDPEDHSSI